MANMDKVSGLGEKGINSWEYTDSLSGAGDGAYVLIPNWIRSVCVGLIISSGTGSIQFTLSSKAKVEAGTANWVTWDYGTVATTTTDVFYPCTAIRQVNATGTTVLEVIAR